MNKLIESHGWGCYPTCLTKVSFPKDFIEAGRLINENEVNTIRGMGRSYGDSSLGPSTLDTQFLKWFISFDDRSGLLTCAAGVTIAEIVDTFAPIGWFPPVTPGTRFVTVGGAIASDVHGKNHHTSGTFCNHVTEIEIILGNGEKVIASLESNRDLFHATCGGMGLTGLIVSAAIRLKPIASNQILETTIKAKDLETVLTLFDENAGYEYSVAWIDCLAKGKSLGRSILTLGEHSKIGSLGNINAKQISIPTHIPSWLLNKHTVSAFNSLYYSRIKNEPRTRPIYYSPFFYPLDAISNWNYLYGRNGFLQYQFVLPLRAGENGLKSILEMIAESGRGSFLAVLKRFGPANNNLLSFPIEGYTLALDFKVSPSVFQLLDKLDAVVLKYGGRLYLTKDSRMSENTFKSCYQNWQLFEEVRMKYHASGKFSSMQSERIGLK